jgi:peptidoglycan/xylan/chitin deacetylase (PgdA/CDA1 family)
MFVPTGWIGGNHPDVDGERILDASEIRRLAEDGVEIGAHTVDHVRLPELGFDEALDQLKRSRVTLEDLVGKPVRTMAYPYGALNAETERAAALAGYEVACGCAGPAPWRALSLPREPVFASASTLRLRLKMAGLYGPVHRLGGTRDLVARWRAAWRRNPGDVPLA